MVRLHRLESVAAQLNVPEEVVSLIVRDLYEENKLHGLFDPQKNTFLRVRNDEAQTLGAELNNNITVLSELIEKLDLPAETVHSLVNWLVSRKFVEGFFTVDDDFFVGKSAFFESIRIDLRKGEPVLAIDLKANLKVGDEQMDRLLDNCLSEGLVTSSGRIFSVEFVKSVARKALTEWNRISLTMDRLSRISGLDIPLICQAFQYLGEKNFPGWNYEADSRILVRQNSVSWDLIYAGFNIAGETAIGNWEFGEELTCCVCQLKIRESQTYTVCRHCGKEGHLNHFLGWVNVKGNCPFCQKPLNEADLRSRSRQYLIN